MVMVVMGVMGVMAVIMVDMAMVVIVVKEMKWNQMLTPKKVLFDALRFFAFRPIDS